MKVKFNHSFTLYFSLSQPLASGLQIIDVVSSAGGGGVSRDYEIF